MEITNAQNKKKPGFLFFHRIQTAVFLCCIGIPHFLLLVSVVLSIKDLETAEKKFGIPMQQKNRSV